MLTDSSFPKSARQLHDVLLSFLRMNLGCTLTAQREQTDIDRMDRGQCIEKVIYTQFLACDLLTISGSQTCLHPAAFSDKDGKCRICLFQLPICAQDKISVRTHPSTISPAEIAWKTPSALGESTLLSTSSTSTLGQREVEHPTLR